MTTGLAPNILFLRAPSTQIPSEALGGIERLICYQVAELRRRGRRAGAVVIGNVEVTNRIHLDFANFGIAAYLVCESRKWRAIDYIREIAAAGRPLVLVAEGDREAVLACRALFGIRDVKIFWRHHTLHPSPWHRRALYRVLDLSLFRQVHRHLAISRQVADLLTSVRGVSQPVRIVPNGVPAPRSETHLCTEDANRLPPRVGMVARIDLLKGHSVLVQAIALLKNKAALDVTATLVGTGPEEPALREMASRLKVADCLEFRGELAAPWAALTSVEVVVLPSLSEGVPLVILEALARRKLVVASEVGAVSEVIQDGINGRLVPPGNAAALAEVLLEIFRQPSQLLAPLRCRAAEMFERQFTVGRSCDCLETVLAEL